MAGQFERGFWTRILREKGLESPGREQAVQEAILFTQQKKLAKENKPNKKK